MSRYLVGIDPGVNTGVACWDLTLKRLTMVASMPIHRAMSAVRDLHAWGELAAVYWEDARMRTWFGSKGRESLMGAGSIRRDCTIWQDMLAELPGLASHPVKPQAGGTKWTAAAFAKLTKWPGRTNEHARDAALLVYGRAR